MNVAILIENQTNTKTLVQLLLKGGLAPIPPLNSKRTGIFSTHELERFMYEEEKHDYKVLTKNTTQALRTMSSGERKKALLDHLLQTEPELVFLVNPYDHLDRQTKLQLSAKLEELSKHLSIVQILSRNLDALSTTQTFYRFQNERLLQVEASQFLHNPKTLQGHTLSHPIPQPIQYWESGKQALVVFNKVNVSFNGRPVLQEINWAIYPNQFWQLKGPNGSGKSTLLQLITGDSHKGYGQDLFLFGYRKGNGESVWDIKKNIGYFTPAMIDRFNGYHTLEQMLISGLHDSVGLYHYPTEIEKAKAREWMRLLGMDSKKDHNFHRLSEGEKRLVMTARAMIKHPPLLILDEPTAGLDDTSALFFVQLVNAFAAESPSTVLFVSHRDEEGLQPRQVIELDPTPLGSVATIIHS